MLCVGSGRRKTTIKSPLAEVPAGDILRAETPNGCHRAQPFTPYKPAEIMSQIPDTSDPRYPIGTFTRKAQYSAAEREGFIARLVDQPSGLAAALSGLTAEQLNSPYRTGGWTIAQLVHHVADSHMHMYIRV